jgi:hypothetical protein
MANAFLGNLDALFEQAEFLSMLFLVTEVTSLFPEFSAP